jgi:hypothetical protein
MDRHGQTLCGRHAAWQQGPRDQNLRRVYRKEATTRATLSRNTKTPVRTLGVPSPKIASPVLPNFICTARFALPGLHCQVCTARFALPGLHCQVCTATLEAGSTSAEPLRPPNRDAGPLTPQDIQLRKLERRFGRALRPRPAGRPPKERARRVDGFRRPQSFRSSDDRNLDCWREFGRWKPSYYASES